MRFLCCCCCRRRSVDENNDADVVENARAADSDSDSLKHDSLDNFRFRENDYGRPARSPGVTLPGGRTANAAAGNKEDFVPCYGPKPETALIHKHQDRGEWVPLVLGSPDSPDSPPIVARTVAASTAAAPVSVKTGTAAPPKSETSISASESVPLSLKTINTSKAATSEISSASDANAKMASVAAAAAAVAAAKSAARSAASVPQGNAKATSGAAVTASVPQAHAKTATGAAAPASKTVPAATASAPQGNAKATAGAAAAPKANAKATTIAAAASTTNGATAATSAPKGNTKATTGVAASVTLPKTTTAPPARAAVSASAVSAPQKNSKVSPTEGAQSKITKISTATAAKVSSSVADEAVCSSLLTLINQLRISKEIKPLRLCDRLRPVAFGAWKAREAAKDGLAVMPKCQTTIKLKSGEVAIFDCLSYLDIPLHSKEGLPAAAMHFWEHAGSYKTNSGQRPLKSESAFPAAGTPARRELDACKQDFEALLLASRNTRVCLRLARTSRAIEDEAEPGKQPLALVAVFAPEDAKP